METMPETFNTLDDNKRQFIRHASSVPLHFHKEEHRHEPPQELTDISHGGLAFMSTVQHQPGDVIELSFPSLENHPIVEGEIVWSRETPGTHTKRYHEGLRFLSEADHFRARLVEQICYIEAYTEEQKQSGREISPEEAAEEWARKFAASFPE